MYLQSDGAGRVAMVRSGVADWRQGRPGRTGSRSKARGRTVHRYASVGFFVSRERRDRAAGRSQARYRSAGWCPARESTHTPGAAGLTVAPNGKVTIGGASW